MVFGLSFFSLSSFLFDPLEYEIFISLIGGNEGDRAALILDPIFLSAANLNWTEGTLKRHTTPEPFTLVHYRYADHHVAR